MKVPVLFLVFLCGAVLPGCGGGGSGRDAISPFYVQGGVAVADLDLDGLADLVVVQTYIAGPPPHPGTVEIHRQTPGGAFMPPVSYPVGSDPWNLAVGDINGDSLPDIVVANSTSGTVSLLLQDTAGQELFLAAREVTAGGTPYAVAISDINADGAADLVVALQNTGGGATVFYQDPDAAPSFDRRVDLANNSGAIAVTVADLNQDGLPDVVISGAQVAVFFQHPGGGTFAAPVLLATGIRPAAVAVADMDDDGINDLVVAHRGNESDGSGATIAVLLQSPEHPGTFLSALVVPVAAGARQLAIGRLDADLLPDIAVISMVYSAQQESRVTVVHNRLPDGFVVSQEIAGAFSSDFIALGDLNNDGLTDLVINDGPQVFFQRGSPPGTFDMGIPLP
ncbi:MAG: VCBS repeat-containing protein [Desulfuromonadaceae bacterium]|nr:VCBS repeat-containing protein [Desulfuromonadaceae bacterium]